MLNENGIVKKLPIFNRHVIKSCVWKVDKWELLFEQEEGYKSPDKNSSLFSFER